MRDSLKLHCLRNKFVEPVKDIRQNLKQRMGTLCACLFVISLAATTTPTVAKVESARAEAFYKYSAGGFIAKFVVLYTDGTMLQINENTGLECRTVKLTIDEHEQIRHALRQVSLKNIDYQDNTTMRNSSHTPTFCFWYAPDLKSQHIVAGCGDIPSRLEELESRLCNSKHRKKSIHWQPEQISMYVEPGNVVQIYADWPKELKPLSSGYRKESVESVKGICKSLVTHRVRFVKDRGRFWYIKSVAYMLPESQLTDAVEKRVDAYLRDRNMYGDLTKQSKNYNAKEFLHRQSDNLQGVDSNRNQLSRSR